MKNIYLIQELMNYKQSNSKILITETSTLVTINKLVQFQHLTVTLDNH
jgi:hypothetical protein